MPQPKGSYKKRGILYHRGDTISNTAETLQKEVAKIQIDLRKCGYSDEMMDKIIKQ